MKRKSILICFSLVVVLVVGIFFFFLFLGERRSTACFKTNCFNVELAMTAEERSRGLMFREELDSNEGMLFIFNDEAAYSFWMKNTLIPLDIIWLNRGKEVVFISKNVQLCENDSCPLISSNKKALYVLELNAGMADKIGLNVGDKMSF